MAQIRAFDRYKHIDYQDITRLFWGVYPYQVRLKATNYEVAEIPFRLGNTPESQQAWNTYRSSRRNYYVARLWQCPKDETTWCSRQHNDGLSFSFYFKDREDAFAFIRKNNKNVTKVCRPTKDGEIAALAANRKLLLRDMLYYNRYRYCIEFKQQANTDLDDDLDNRIYDLFQNLEDDARYFLSLSNRRRLYLNIESDIIYVKLALYEHFYSQTEVLLKEEVQ